MLGSARCGLKAGVWMDGDLLQWCWSMRCCQTVATSETRSAAASDQGGERVTRILRSSGHGGFHRKAVHRASPHHLHTGRKISSGESAAPATLALICRRRQRTPQASPATSLVLLSRYQARRLTSSTSLAGRLQPAAYDPRPTRSGYTVLSPRAELTTMRILAVDVYIPPGGRPQPRHGDAEEQTTRLLATSDPTDHEVMRSPFATRAPAQ